MTAAAKADSPPGSDDPHPSGPAEHPRRLVGAGGFEPPTP